MAMRQPARYGTALRPCLLFCFAVVLGCGSNNTSPGTIAGMRGSVSGDYTLTNVTSLAITPSGSLMLVQDPAGGAYSAIQVLCSSTSTTHPCPVSSTVKATFPGHSLTLSGSYVKAASGLEEFYLTAITDNGPSALPAPTMLMLADVVRSASTPASWFQRVSVSLPGKLVLYDFTPAELSYGGATKCPYQLGFGMIAASEGAPVPAACTSTTAQPAGVSSPSPKEVLIGTDFFHDFTVSTDCRCAATFSDKEPLASSSIASGQSLAGILFFALPVV